MKKIILIPLFLLILLLSGCNQPNETQTENEEITTSENQPTPFTKPEPKADLNGSIKSIIGNEITITVRDMSSLENGEIDRDALREKMQNMSDIERQKMLTEMMASIKTEDIKVLFPVGIPMGIAERSGNRDDSDFKITYKDASLENVKIGKNVTVWLNKTEKERKIAEVVIISAGRTSGRGNRTGGMGGGFGGGGMGRPHP